MRDVANGRRWSAMGLTIALASALWLGWEPRPALAGKLSWLDEVVQQVVRETEAGGKAAARNADELAGAATRGGTRLFAREADESLEILARRSDDLARAGRTVENTSEALLQRRFARLLPDNPGVTRAFDALAPAEKRLVVEMSETAQRLARRYPGQADNMIRALGTEGMTAVRVYGDDVAEVVVKEGPEALGVLRKTGRGGWAFFNETVLPHKKKLMAAGVFGAFLADPDKFVDVAGRATEYAVREFARAGVQISGAVAGAAVRGLEATLGELLAAYGLNFAIFRYMGIAAALLVVIASGLVLVGLPVRWMLRPFVWPLKLLKIGVRPRTAG